MEFSLWLQLLTASENNLIWWLQQWYELNDFNINMKELSLPQFSKLGIYFMEVSLLLKVTTQVYCWRRMSVWWYLPWSFKSQTEHQFTTQGNERYCEQHEAVVMQNWFLYNKRKGKCEHKLGYYILLYVPRSCNIKPELRIPPFLKALAVDTDRLRFQ